MVEGAEPRRRLQEGKRRSRALSSPAPTKSGRVFTRKSSTQPLKSLSHFTIARDVTPEGSEEDGPRSGQRQPRYYLAPRPSPPLTTRRPHGRESQPAPATRHPPLGRRPPTIQSRRSGVQREANLTHRGEPQERSRPPLLPHPCFTATTSILPPTGDHQPNLRWTRSEPPVHPELKDLRRGAPTPCAQDEHPSTSATPARTPPPHRPPSTGTKKTDLRASTSKSESQRARERELWGRRKELDVSLAATAGRPAAAGGDGGEGD
jgi:hypothetical protein